MNEMEILNQTTNKTPKFSFDTKTYNAKVVHVVDGDTINVTFIPFGDPVKISVRLEGIDTCEIHSKNEEEKKYGLQAKEKLLELVLDKIVTLKCGKFDKYGRLLGRIFLDGIDICEVMKQTTYTTEYHGGAKLPYDQRT